MTDEQRDIPDNHDEEQEQQNVPAVDFPVVGIGASAGGINACERFFENLPSDSGMAFVLVQHLSPDYESELASLLQKRTNMTVAEVEDDPDVLPDHVYVIPPNKNLSMAGGVLHLSDWETERVKRAPIDFMLRSLAQDQGENAVCIILSGTGSDGTLGLKAIKENAGITMAQDPDDAEYPDMPRSAIETGLVDIVAPADELARKLIDYRETASLVQVPITDEHLPDDDHDALTKIFTQLRSKTGHDFTYYKRSTILRRIARRLQVNKIESLPAYLEYIRAHPDEAQVLFRDFLITVTNFFRDPEAFEALQEKIVPRLFEGKSSQDQVRIWVAGCATGEEAYSIAMLLYEYAANAPTVPEIQVFATDLDEDAIATARSGVYSSAITADVSPERLKRFFSEVSNGYAVKNEIREMVIFAEHNLLKDPPFSRLDLISCRNLLIYLKRDIQTHVLELFHYALRPGGYLFLGSAESHEVLANLFITEDKKQHLYRRRDAATSTPRFPALTPVRRQEVRAEELSTESQQEPSPSLEQAYEAWSLRQHTPPRLLVDENYTITHSFRGAWRYLQEQEGPVTLNVLEQILPALRLELRSALYQAFEKGERVETRYLPVTLQGASRFVRMRVGPIEGQGFPDGYVEVVFEEVAEAERDHTGSELEERHAESGLVANLEEELERTREQLQKTIEEYVTSNEELKASNEELQSMNEELRSTAEELETSKEELQSMNEELLTVNQELKTKIDELSRANSDLQNFITATNISTVFLNRNLRVQRFTPPATELFHLIPSDVGRPFEHVSHALKYDDIVDDARYVLDNLATVEREIQSTDGQWYIVRLFPYRTVKDVIDGVVITCVDVTELKNVERALHRRAAQQSAINEFGHFALQGAELDELFDEATRRVAETLDVDFSGVLALRPNDELLLEAGVGWDEGRVGTATKGTGRESQAGYTLHVDSPLFIEELSAESRFETPALLESHGIVSGITAVIEGDERPYGVLGVYTSQRQTFTDDDIDFVQGTANVLAEAIQRKRYEKAVQEAEARLRRLFKQAPAQIAMVEGSAHVVTFSNDLNNQLFGQRELIGKPLPEAVPELAEQGVLEKFDEVYATGTPYIGREVRLEIDRNADGTLTEGYYNVTLQPIYDDAGNVEGVVSFSFDVTELVRSRLKLETVFESMHEALILADQEGVIVDLNPAAARFHRFTDESDVPEHIEGFIGLFELRTLNGAHVISEDQWPIQRALRGERFTGYEVEVRRTDTDESWIGSYAGMPVHGPNGDFRFAAITIRDVTERVRAEAQLAALNETLEDRVHERMREVRALASALTLAEQRERQRISRVLHDHVQQLLHSLQVKTDMIRDLDPSDQPQALADIEEIIEEAVDATRTLAVNLSPPVLESEGFKEALDWLATQMRQRHGLNVQICDEGGPQLQDEELRVVTFQIVRELLFNVVKHANVDEATVNLSEESGCLLLIVEDKGKGFDKEAVLEGDASAATGMGLPSIRDRLNLFGGQMELESIPGDGTRVTVCVPAALDA